MYKVTHSQLTLHAELHEMFLDSRLPKDCSTVRRSTVGQVGLSATPLSAAVRRSDCCVAFCVPAFAVVMGDTSESIETWYGYVSVVSVGYGFSKIEFVQNTFSPKISNFRAY